MYAVTSDIATDCYNKSKSIQHMLSYMGGSKSADIKIALLA